MRFAKGHGTENDFVILPDPDGAVDLSGDLAVRLCDRRAGLGADGVLRAIRAAAMAGAAPGGPDGGPGWFMGYRNADGSVAEGAPDGGPGWFMDYRNADGSVAEMCGNGIRVFARYLIEHGLVSSGEFAVATRAGTRRVRAGPDGAITVDMGPPRVLGPGRASLAGQPFDGLAVSLGNPHLACVVSEPLDGFDLSLPPAFDPGQFPEGGNFELVRLVGPGHIEMRVYERGCGATRSCGTGAVAAAVAAATPAPGAPVPEGSWTVDLPGGRLRVILGGQTSFLSGPAVIVAEGELDNAWLAGRPGGPASHSWLAAPAMGSDAM